MNLELILLQVLRYVAGHMANIDTMRGIIEEVVQETTSLEEVLHSLTARLKTADVTLQTDIHILINEIKHRESKGEFLDE